MRREVSSASRCVKILQGLMGVAALALCACSGVKGAEDGFATETGGWDTGSVSDTGSDPEDSGEAVWWKLGAAISIWEGAVLPEESSLGLTLLLQDGSVLCEDTLAIRELTVEEDLPDATIYSWWRVEAESPQGSCAELRDPVPSPVLIGVGAMHPDIFATLDPEGLADGASSLNAAYASINGGEDVYVFGVAGTTAAYLGDAAPADSSLLADGVWIVRPVYPFAYE